MFGFRKRRKFYRKEQWSSNIHIDVEPLLDKTKKVRMTTRRPSYLRDPAGRKLLELPEKVRPPRFNQRPAVRPRPRPRPSTHPLGTAAAADRLLGVSSSFAASPAQSPRPPARRTPRSLPRTDLQDPRIPAPHPTHSAAVQRRQPKPQCRPREVRDIQLLLPTPDLFKAPVVPAPATEAIPQAAAGTQFLD